MKLGFSCGHHVGLPSEDDHFQDPSDYAYFMVALVSVDVRFCASCWSTAGGERRLLVHFLPELLRLGIGNWRLKPGKVRIDQELWEENRTAPLGAEVWLFGSCRGVVICHLLLSNLM